MDYDITETRTGAAKREVARLFAQEEPHVKDPNVSWDHGSWTITAKDGDKTKEWYVMRDDGGHILFELVPQEEPST